MNKTNFILIVAIVLLMVSQIWMVEQGNKLQEKIAHQESVISEQSAEIIYRRNNAGHMVADKAAAHANLKVLMKAYPKLLQEEMKKEFDVELKRMKVYIKNEFEAHGKGTSTVNNYYDTINQKTYRRVTFSDQYLSFQSFIDSTNTAISKYVYQDTIKIVIHSKKKWFLGDEKLIASAVLANPNAHISESTNIVVKDHRDKRWVVSLGIYGDPIRETWGAGIHIGYALIKF